MVKNLKKIPIILTIIIIIPSLISTSTIANLLDEESNINNLVFYEKGFRYERKGWIYLHIEGEPYNRGFQYGYLASDEIIDIIHRWCEWLRDKKLLNLFKDYNEKEFWNDFKDKVKGHFLKHIPKEYLQELEGMAEGMNQNNVKLFDKKIETEDIITLQFVQDIYYSFYKYPLKKYHPFRGAVSGFINFLLKLFGKNEDEHCIAFIATGDASKNGEIVVAHSTRFDPLISQKCNIILDLKPTNGYHFLMTTFPGAIWSCEDYYQNEQGIVLTETELPQGPWDEEGVPKGIRSRNAIQYSSSIDEVIDYLMEGNNGLIPNEWLIGDIKTGEIASLEQALYNTPIKRTYNGFYWSCNIAHSYSVKTELDGVPATLIEKAIRVIPKIVLFPKVNKFIQIENDYYGRIDLDAAKIILSLNPLSQDLTDGKISNSSLLKNMSLFTHFGNPDGSTFIASKEEKQKYDNMADLPAYGWIKINPSEMVGIVLDGSDLLLNEPNKTDIHSNIYSSILILFLVISLIFIAIFSTSKYLKRRNKK